MSMPYEAREVPGDKNGAWEVLNIENKEVKATHEPPDAKDKAEAQVRLLEAIEKNPGWEPGHGAE